MVVVEKNIMKIEKIERKLLKIVKPSKLYKEYLEKAQGINEMYCHRDENWNPKFKESWEWIIKYSIKKTHKEEFEECHKELEEEYKEVISNYQWQCDKYNSKLQEPVSIRFRKIDRKHILPGHTDLLIQRLWIFIKPTFKETLEIYKKQLLLFIDAFREHPKYDIEEDED